MAETVLKPVQMSPDEFVREAVRIVEEASRRKVVLRVLGALAIYIHSMHDQDAIGVYRSVGRLEGSAMFTDLDLAAYSKQRGDVMRFFERELGFSCHSIMKALYGHKRLIYFHPAGLYYVDVFFDKLEFNHDVVWGSAPGRGRLELDYPTVSLADLVLEKLQITRITRKDLVDLIVLLKAHDVCTESRECIDADHIAVMLSDDWGFWYDAVNNLRKLKELSDKLVAEGKISESVASAVKSRAEKILSAVDSRPKSLRWIMRSKIGTSRPWYREVEDVLR